MVSVLAWYSAIAVGIWFGIAIAARSRVRRGNDLATHVLGSAVIGAFWPIALIFVAVSIGVGIAVRLDERRDR